MKIMSTKEIGGIYRGWWREIPGQQWILEWPDPMGVSEHLTLREAKQAARKAGLTPRRWYGCDAYEVDS